MAKTAKVIKIKWVQMMDRANGLTLIGQPVPLKFGLEVREKLFGNNPAVILYPSVAPDKLKKVM
jgi:hypothetical protein